LAEVKGRARELLNLNEADIAQVASKEATALVRVVRERLNQKPGAYVGDLFFNYKRGADTDERTVLPGIRIKERGDTVKITMTASGELGWFRGSDTALGIEKTRSLIATVLTIAEELKTSARPPRYLVVDAYSLQGGKLPEQGHSWLIDDGTLFKAGFRDSTSIKIDLTDDGREGQR
jgi:hypothetical protein